jgi:hypothetical protein
VARSRRHAHTENGAATTGAVTSPALTSTPPAVPNPDGSSDTGHGFVQDRRGHTTSLDVPGAAVTLPNGINDHGQLAEEDVDADIVPLPRAARLLPVAT